MYEEERRLGNKQRVLNSQCKMFHFPAAPGQESRKFNNSQAVILQKMLLGSQKGEGHTHCHKPTSGIVKIQFLNSPPSG